MPARLGRTGRALCLAGAALGVLGLTGWVFAAEIMTTFVAGRPAMMPNTALALVMLGLAAASSPSRATSRTSLRATLAAALAIGVLAIGLATVLQYVAGWNFGIDEFLFPIASPASFPGRPSPLTAIALSLLATAQLIPIRRFAPAGRLVGLAESLTLLGAFLGFVSLVGHLFGAGQIYQMQTARAIGVALPTAMALLLIAFGSLLRDSDLGTMRLATSAGPGGLLMRRLGVIAILGPPLLGVAAHRAILLAGFVDLPLTLAVLTTVGVPVALIPILITAEKLDAVHLALEASRGQARSLVDESADGIFVADLDGRYVDVNAAGCQMLGRPREDIIGRSIGDLIPAEDVGRLAEAKAQLLAGGTQTAEWLLLKSDGSYLPVEVSAKILADGRWQGIVRDITRRKAAERAARRLEARLEGIISIAADAIISVDGQQRIVMYNEGAKRIFGWSADEVLGKPLDVLLPERFHATHGRNVRTFDAEPAAARMMAGRPAVIGLRKSGEEFPAEAAISKLETDGERLFTVFLRDVTATRRLQDELRTAVEAAQAATRARDEMLSVVAHDLRSPLAAAQAGASLLARQVPEDRREASRRTVDKVHRSIRLAARLVGDLLDVSRIEAGKLALSLKEIPADLLVHHAVSAYLQQAEDVSVQIVTEAPAGVGLVLADEDRIQQVLGNLLDNALKFTPSGGQVRVTVRRVKADAGSPQFADLRCPVFFDVRVP